MKGQIFQNIFEELQTGDGSGEILTFLDNSILITIALRQPNDLETEFAAAVSEILENHLESFF